MYLTRFTINKARRGAQRLLSQPQSMHAAVLSSFPDPSPTEEGRVLYRVDTGRPNPTLLISSPRKPDLTHLVEQAGWAALEGGWETRDYAPVLDAIQIENAVFRFRFAANPTMDVKGKRCAHVTTEQKIAWLGSRAVSLGVIFQEVDLTNHSLENFARAGKKVTLSRATFEGILKVADASTLENTLRFGYGHGKAYGCGLMTLARL